jgi:hypothetical protein
MRALASFYKNADSEAYMWTEADQLKPKDFYKKLAVCYPTAKNLTLRDHHQIEALLVGARYSDLMAEEHAYLTLTT